MSNIPHRSEGVSPLFRGEGVSPLFRGEGILPLSCCLQ